MRFSLLFFTAPLLCQLAAAVDAGIVGHPVLQPTSDDGWFGAVRKRSAQENLKLLDYEHLIWSSAPNATENVFVNMTMFTSDDEMIINMERFSPQLKAVNCSENMMMSFKSKSSYQEAVRSWEWVNFSENRTFIMIANAAGCGRARSRQPWIVSTVEYDPRHLTVHLNATKKDWKEVAHSYNMDFGQYGPATPAPPSTHQRRMTFDHSVNLDLNAQAPVQFFTQLNIPNGISFALTCTKCGTRGNLLLSGHIETWWFEMKSFTISAVPKGIKADLNMKFSLSMVVPGTEFSPEPITFFSIPLAGFAIPDLLQLGPALTLGAGLKIVGAQGTANIAAEINATIPDTAVAEWQLAGDNKSANFHGWEPQFTNGPIDISEALTASVEVFGRAEVGVALELLGTGIDIGLVLKVPDVTLSASLIHDTKGVCPDKKFQEGVTLGLSVGADLGISGSTRIAGFLQEFLKVPVFHNGFAFRPQGPCKGFGELTPVANPAQIGSHQVAGNLTATTAAAITAITATTKLSSNPSKGTNTAQAPNHHMVGNLNATTTAVIAATTKQSSSLLKGTNTAKVPNHYGHGSLTTKPSNGTYYKKLSLR